MAQILHNKDKARGISQRVDAVVKELKDELCLKNFQLDVRNTHTDPLRARNRDEIRGIPEKLRLRFTKLTWIRMSVNLHLFTDAHQGVTNPIQSFFLLSRKFCLKFIMP